MNRIGLIEVGKNIISRLRSNTELLLAQLDEFDEVTEFISLLKEDAQAFDVVVVGQPIPEPILLAQQIQLLDKTTTVLLHADAGDWHEISVSFAENQATIILDRKTHTVTSERFRKPIEKCAIAHFTETLQTKDVKIVKVK